MSSNYSGFGYAVTCEHLNKDRGTTRLIGSLVSDSAFQVGVEVIVDSNTGSTKRKIFCEEYDENTRECRLLGKLNIYDRMIQEASEIRLGGEKEADRTKAFCTYAEPMQKVTEPFPCDDN